MSERTTIVTGAAQGIGRACALRQAARGDRVHAWDVDRDGAEAVAKEVRDSGGSAVAAPVDLGDTVASREAVAAVAAEAAVTGLVHAAGLMRTVPFEQIDEAEYDRVVDVNQRGTFFLVKAAAEAMRSAGVGGSIVLFSSIAGRKGRPLAAHYAATKAATISFAQSAAMRFGPEVRVNAVAPGVIATPMMRQIAEERHELLGSSLDQPYPGIEEEIALRRIGEPDDVARVVEFLLGDLAAYVSGQTINVDGGLEFD